MSFPPSKTILESIFVLHNLILHSCYELHEALQSSVWHVTLVVAPLACRSRTLTCTHRHTEHLTFDTMFPHSVQR